MTLSSPTLSVPGTYTAIAAFTSNVFLTGTSRRRTGRRQFTELVPEPVLMDKAMPSQHGTIIETGTDSYRFASTRS